MMRKLFVFILALALAGAMQLAGQATIVHAEAAAGYTDSTDQLNYSIGHQVGRDLVRQHAEVRPEVLLQGIIDATSGVEPKMSYAEMIDRLAIFKKEIVASAEGELVKYRRAGERFLAQNAKKEGVFTLPSGLQYKVLKQGEGKVPSASDMVRVNYIGKKLDGTSFDSTYKDGVATPVEFQVSKVIPGWSEALEKMPVGSKWELYVPHDLAYRDLGPLAGQTVIFEVELLDILASNK